MKTRNNKRIAISGTGGSASAKVISDLLATKGDEPKRQCLVIVSGRSRADRLAQDLSFFCDREILVLPPDDDVLLNYDARNQDNEIERARVLKAVREEEGILVVAPASGAFKKLPRPDAFEKNSIKVSIGDELSPDKVRESLVLMGYESVDLVYGPGQFSFRGGIVDVFTPYGTDPVRIEFFGDEVDGIRSFEANTQRSIGSLESVELLPASTNKYEDDAEPSAYIWDYMSARVMPSVNELVNASADESGDGPADETSDRTGGGTRVVTSLAPLVVFEDPDRIYDYLELREQELWSDLEYLIEKDKATKEDAKKITGIADLTEAYSLPEVIFLQPFAKAIKGVDTLDELRSFSFIPVTNYNGHMELLRKDMADWGKKGYRVEIAVSSERRMETLGEFLSEEGFNSFATLREGSVSAGLILPEEGGGRCYISDGDIFDTSKTFAKKKKKASSRGRKLQSFTELKPGEYVVHEDHGIGVFQGIVELETLGTTKDCIKIKYQGSSVLYVPVESMDEVQKYIGSEGKAPKISKLGSDEWERTKQRARKAISDMTDELVELYAKRKASKGYAFSEDTVWQKDFEDDFPYEETEDQLQAIEEIKADMEKAEPMDRLLCGDVGYGKTEVAARAIFKCLIEGKQAAMLVPTTILASQHYETLKERFKNFPFTIELMSRFRSDKELDKIAEGLAKDKVDLVIGTHRILSKDVKFKDLGLLVVDEEQRFGVAHKEKIKQMKAGVDVLTLSATPIPRTLNMSLTGIRDMSLINEPPEERYPVQTYVLEQDDSLIREIIQRELDRGGQVFAVYNRVRGIHRIAEKLQTLVPEARIAIGHGQMGEKTLEEVMRGFVAGETDILVATTIVESGLDIPNANTMIVFDADKCGLSQLYQLRGRVGRSNRIAYAYLTYQKDKVLTEIAEKRLRAIREFTEFGAGFKIAMRDMELRGAGNILGAEQSGHMMDVGYEMYARMVDEAARRVRGEKIPEKREGFTLELKTVANIPKWYITEENIKLALYKRIADIESAEDSEDVMDELLDRFGDIPSETINLIKVSRIRYLASTIGIARIYEQQDRVYITFGEGSPVNAYTVMKLGETFGPKVFYHDGKESYISFSKNLEKLDMTLDILELIKAS